MIWAVVLLCLSFANCETVVQISDKLVFVHAIFRHGDRTIRNSYANDPYKTRGHWPEGFGQLTTLGKQRQFELGKFLRRRYDKFLGTYSADKITVLSSDYDRTINSASLVLAGLFPPIDNQIWSQDLLWQPIAVHSIPKKIDYMIHGQACNRYNKAHDQFLETPEVKTVKEQHQELFGFAEKHSGQAMTGVAAMKDLYETLLVEKESNKTLPEWAREIFIPGGALDSMRTYYLKFLTGTTELKRLKSGFLLKDIFDRFRNKTLSLLPDKLMQIYSGHDITLTSLLDTLGVFDLHVPPYSACVLFELYESGEHHYVQLFYRNSTTDDLNPLNIPGVARTLTPANKNFTTELPTLEAIADVNSTEVQWLSLNLGEPPC